MEELPPLLQDGGGEKFAIPHQDKSLQGIQQGTKSDSLYQQGFFRT